LGIVFSRREVAAKGKGLIVTFQLSKEATIRHCSPGPSLFDSGNNKLQFSEAQEANF